MVSARFDPKYGFGSLNPLIQFDNGSVLRFKTSGQDSLDLASATINSAAFDEPPRSMRTFTEIQKRLQHNAGRLLIAMTPANVARLDWLRERVQTMDLHERPLLSEHHARFIPETFVPVGTTRPLRLLDGTPKDQAWIDSITVRTIEQERPVTLHGEWDVRSTGAIFRAFRQRWEAPPNRVTVRVGVDHGSGRNFSQCSVVCYVAGPIGNESIWVAAEYVSQHSTTTKEDAVGVLRMLTRAGLTWEQVDTAYGDQIHHGGRHGRDRKSNPELHAAVARQLGKPASQCAPRLRNAKRGTGQKGQLSRDVQWLNQAMVDGRFYVHPRCSRMIASLEQWDYRPREDGRRAHKNSVDSDWKHIIDSARYALREELSRRPRSPSPLHNG